MKKARTEFETIAKALSICMPETKEESLIACEECPLFDDCKGDDSIAFPSVLGIAIRNYFSSNKISSNIIQ